MFGRSFLRSLAGVGSALVVLLSLGDEAAAGSYSCTFYVSAGQLPPDAGDAPTWSDTRYQTVEGRRAILREASILAFKKLQRCERSGASTPLSAQLPCTDDCAIDLSSWGSSRNWKNVYCNLSLHAQYEPIQKQANKGAGVAVVVTDIDEGWWAEPVGFAPTEFQIPANDVVRYMNDEHIAGVDHRIRTEINATVDLFPAVFERHQLWLKSEKRWARTPVEATAYALLHELGHLESEMASHLNKKADKAEGSWVGIKYGEWSGKNLLFTPMDGSEDGAWAYAQSVMRCTGE